MNEVEEIKARLDIVDVIGQYVQLQKAGRTFKANCPFHNERTPSFVVSPERQSWHCFGACGSGGDMISFVMRKDGLEFPEALRLLAERAGVRLRERQVSEAQDRQRERLFAANQEAASYYLRLLTGDSGKSARRYLEQRGVDADTAKAFLLGYSPPGWEALRDHLRERGFTEKEMLAAGLVMEGERGLHDRFRGRLMFAIRDGEERVIGFGARALDGSLPKYINTSQTSVFDKGGTLYALDLAQPAIRREGRAVIVEGYMDAIAAHQHSFDNVVASMGTALTERQVRLLKKLADAIVLALDADAAGNEAAVRGHDVVREALSRGEGVVPVVSWRGLVQYQETAGVDLRVAVLPEGRDPDEVIRSDGDLWRQIVDTARPVLDYRLEAAAAAHDLADPRGRSDLVREFIPLLTTLADPVVRAHYVQRLSRISRASEEELATMLRRGAIGKTFGSNKAAVGGPVRRGDPREEFLLALLFRYPDIRAEALDIQDDLLWETENRQVLAAWKQVTELDDVKNALPVELVPYVERLTVRTLPSFDLKQAREALLDCRLRLERRALEAEKQAMSSLLATREEELGVSALAEATVSAMSESKRNEDDLVELQFRDMETGLKLHGRERSDGNSAVETRNNG